MSDWSGMLTINNVEEIVNKLRSALLDKTFRVENTGGLKDIHRNLCLIPFGNPCEKIVYKGQLSNGINQGIFYSIIPANDVEPASVRVYIRDNRGLSFFNSNLNDDIHDPNFNNAYFQFNKNKVIITFRINANKLPVVSTYIIQSGNRYSWAW